MMLSILEQALIALPLLIGAYLTLSLLKVPDFSIESAYLFGAVVAFLAQDLPLPITLLSACMGGVIVGLCVSLLNQLFNLPFLLAAIITNGLFHGATQLLLGTSVITFRYILPFSEFILLSLLGGLVIFLVCLGLRSQLGLALAIYGNNPRFFAHHSISGRYVLICGVAIGHGCAGVSGFFFSLSNGFVDLTMSFGIILLCLTALICGKMVIRSQKPTIFLPVIGILLYFLIQQTLLRIGLNLKYFNSFQALFVLSALVAGHRKKQTLIDHLGV